MTAAHLHEHHGTQTGDTTGDEMVNHQIVRVAAIGDGCAWSYLGSEKTLKALMKQL